MKSDFSDEPVEALRVTWDVSDATINSFIKRILKKTHLEIEHDKRIKSS